MRNNLSNKALTRREFIKSGLGVGMGLGLWPAFLGFRWRDDELRRYEASYYRKTSNKLVQCQLCPHGCVLEDGQRSNCKVREARGGKLYTLVYGAPCVVSSDPIEKGPIFHMLPGTQTLSISTAGCNLHCQFCQNWQHSQARPEDTRNYNLSPVEVVEKALSRGYKSISFSYTEPTVFYEYMLDVAKLAKRRGLKNIMVSCGYINPQPLRELCQYLDGVVMGLKGFRQEFYRKVCYGDFQPVLEALKVICEQGIWLEIAYLPVPVLGGDDIAVIEKMCYWVKDNLGVGVPLHFLRFVPEYKLKNLPANPIGSLEKARDLGLKMGLNYVYIGNLPGHEGNNTFCPHCKRLLIQRIGYKVLKNYVRRGKCRFCGGRIAGDG